jgi:hypothetical protein
MTNYDGRPPNLRARTGWGGGGWGAGWIVLIIIILIIIGFGWGWGGWYRGGNHVANAPATNTAGAVHTGVANKAPAHTP